MRSVWSPGPFAVRVRAVGIALFASLAMAAAPGIAQEFPYPLLPVFAPFDLAGNAQHPPASPYSFVSHPGVMLIENGLPAGSALVGKLHIYNMGITSEAPGGPLGGEITEFTCRIGFELEGVGAYAVYSRRINVPGTGRFYSSPQVPGALDQSFQIDLGRLNGQVIGDPDFDLLRITAGSDFALPGPGRVHARQEPSGDWSIDSFFDIKYRIDFVGDPGGTFAGMSGSTIDTHRQRSGQRQEVACTEPDNGFGTLDWPANCPLGHRSPTEGIIAQDSPIPNHAMVASFDWNTLAGSVTTAPGGSLGGVVVTMDQALYLGIHGEGDLSGYSRAIYMLVTSTKDVGPEMVLLSHQGRPSELQTLFGQIIGDPDFDLLRITAGSGFGMPSPGHTSLTYNAGGQWDVDSFFDITYRVDYVGALGGPLAGLSGSYIGKLRCQMGETREGECLAPDNGFGTIDFPALCSPGYQSVVRAPAALSGTPANSPLLIDIELVPLSLIGTAPGGLLGGEQQAWNGGWRFHVVGTGVLAGFDRTLSTVGPCETHTAPISGGSPQHFETLVFQAQGQVLGDPDFALLRITAGNNFALPSPGHTTLTAAGGIQWDVDSFFDIEYRIDFVGAPGGSLAGMSGSTTARRHFVQGQQPTLGAPPLTPPTALRLGAAVPNPTRSRTRVSLELPRSARVLASVHDVAGRLVRELSDEQRDAGVISLEWDGHGADGRVVAPGLYLVKVVAGGERLSRRVFVTR